MLAAPMMRERVGDRDAPADGVVSRSGRYGNYGKTIDINHGYGYVTRYAHMSELLVGTGDRVKLRFHSGGATCSVEEIHDE